MGAREGRRKGGRRNMEREGMEGIRRERGNGDKNGGREVRISKVEN